MCVCVGPTVCITTCKAHTSPPPPNTHTHTRTNRTPPQKKPMRYTKSQIHRDARPLPVLFLAADALTFPGRPKEAAAAFCRLEQRLLRLGKGPGREQQEEEEAEEEEWAPLTEGEATVRCNASCLPSLTRPATSHQPTNQPPQNKHKHAQWWLHKVRLGLAAALLKDENWRSALVLLEGMRRVCVCVYICMYCGAGSRSSFSFTLWCGPTDRNWSARSSNRHSHRHSRCGCCWGPRPSCWRAWAGLLAGGWLV